MFNLRHQSTTNKDGKQGNSDYEKNFENLFSNQAPNNSGAKNQQESSMSMEEQIKMRKMREVEEQAKYE